MDKSPITVVEEMYAAWQALDWAKVTDMFCEDGRLIIVPAGHTYAGRTQIRGHLDQVASGIEKLSFDITHIGAVGNIVTFERDDVFIYNGKAARVAVAGILEINGDRVQEWREYFDGYSMQKAMA